MSFNLESFKPCNSTNDACSLYGNVCVVTGAGSGIGQTIAIQLALLGCYVYGIDLSSKGLKKTKSKSRNNHFFGIKSNVSDAIQAKCVFDLIERERRQINLLVLSAGQAKVGKLTGCSLTNVIIEGLIQTNFLGQLLPVLATITLMRPQLGSTKIIYIDDSLGENCDIPSELSSILNVYRPSHLAIRESLRIIQNELIQENLCRIQISIVKTGLVDTPFLKSAGIKNANDLINSLPHLDTKDVASSVTYLACSSLWIPELNLQPQCCF